MRQFSTVVVNIIVVVAILLSPLPASAVGPSMGARLDDPANPDGSQIEIAAAPISAPAIAPDARTTSTAIVLSAAGFAPDQVTIAIDTEVIWTNTTGQRYTLRSGEPPAQRTLYLPLIARQQPSAGVAAQIKTSADANVRYAPVPTVDTFGGELPAGGTYRHTFASVGSHPYYLVEAPDIRGTVMVTSENPVDLAPPLDLTVATDIYSATAFLYMGEFAVQKGMDPATIDPLRVAVLRGQVLDRAGQPLGGVRITILNHPEYGYTQTRADGLFDMVVNGGSHLTVDYKRTGYLGAQRQIDLPWRDYAWAPDVVLVQYDPRVTTVDLGQTAEEFVVARGSRVSDVGGERQGTLLVPKGVEAHMVLPDGSTHALSTLDIRITEYTVGEKGPLNMPAELPPASIYTYAMELSADEAIEAGATDVRFNHPLFYYIEDLIGFPTGGAVPNGYYDRVKGQWIAARNGRVVDVLSVVDSLANLDTDGDGNPDDVATLAELGITDAERSRLGSLYGSALPVRLYRVPIDHFTPWDHNWPGGPPPGAEPPPKIEPDIDGYEPNVCKFAGSIIACQNQVLGQRLDVTGTPFTLNYTSDRVPGRTAAYSLTVPLMGDSLPAGIQKVRLQIMVAGLMVERTFIPRTHLNFTYEWDGRDAYGRTVQGRQPIVIRVGYTYLPVYYASSTDFENAFGKIGDYEVGRWQPQNAMLLCSSRRCETFVEWVIELTQTWHGALGVFDSSAQKLGGWTLDAHHTYDPSDRTLFLGDGSQRVVDETPLSVSTVTGVPLWEGTAPPNPSPVPALEAYLQEPAGLTTGPDGSLYIADSMNQRIVRVNRAGIASTYAGIPDSNGWSGDGGPATNAQLARPMDVAMGSDGVLFIADYGNNCIRRVGADGIISTYAGVPNQAGRSGDGGQAVDARFTQPIGVAVAADGTLYIADSYVGVVRAVTTDGIIARVAGGGAPQDGIGDNGLATDARLQAPTGLSVAADGSLLIAETTAAGANGRIRRLAMDGTITTVAGGGALSLTASEGVRAVDARLNQPYDVEAAPGGGFYFTEKENHRIRYVSPEGIITSVAGSTPEFAGCRAVFEPLYADGMIAWNAIACRPAGIAWSPNGGLYYVAVQEARVREIYRPLPGVSLDDIPVPSEDGSELYHFAADGRHLRTLHTLTGAVLYTFGYDNTGLLNTVTDGDGNVTTIERDVDGFASGIVGPYGQRSTIDINNAGYLSRITNPAGESHSFQYSDGGLMGRHTDPQSYLWLYQYDDSGRLFTATEPTGATKRLTRTKLENGYQVAMTTGEGVTTSYAVEFLSTKEHRLTNTFANGLSNVLLVGVDSSTTVSYTDGMVVTQVLGPDPRWGMQAPIITQYSIATPGGIQYKVSASRSVDLADSADLFSLTTMTDVHTVNGNRFVAVYNGATRTFDFATPVGRTASVVIDEQGRTTDYRFADLAPDRLTYDSRGRLINMTSGDGAAARTYTVDYGADGQISHIVNPLGQILTLTHDAALRVQTLERPDGEQITLGYDQTGSVTALTPPGRPAHNFEYTAVGLLALYDPPTAFAGEDRTRYSYDLDRRLKTVLRPDGKTITYTYEGDRLKTISSPDGAYSYEYHPDSGLLATITAPGNEILRYDYDGGITQQVTWAGTVSGTVGYAYDDALRLQSLSVNGQEVARYVYDADGLMIRAGAMTIERDPKTGFVTRTALDQVVTTNSYNEFGDLAQSTASFQSTVLMAMTYTRDKLGRIVSKTETIEGTTTTYEYGYDAVGRLILVKRNGAEISRYEYDANGNRLRYVGERGTFTGVYDDQDRLLSYGDATYTYTANGELRTKTEGGETTTYNYDVFGNLRSVALPDGTDIEYLIDGQQRRIGRKSNGSLVQGVLHQGQLNPVAELSGSGEIVSFFIHGSSANVPEYVLSNKADGISWVEYRAFYDHLGSPRIMVNASTGQRAQSIGYDEYGNVESNSSEGFQPFGFAGGDHDQLTGLVRFGARDYEAHVARWTAADPPQICRRRHQPLQLFAW
jgi:RHS repeat-associated protein